MVAMSQVISQTLAQEYAARHNSYLRLLSLVAGNISSECETSSIKIHAIKSRIKTFESFAAKIERKKYTNPWRQCEDIAAVRIICLFEDQVPRIVDVLTKSNNLIVVESKKRKKQADQFSYTAYHMIVQHKEMPKEFVCEIQIRTILQDAWAEMEHYVNYKQLSLDEKTQRKVNALSALFEVAEDQFKDIYESFQKLQAPEQNTDVQISAAAIYQYAKKEFASCWNYSPDVAQLDAKEEYELIAQRAIGCGNKTMGAFFAQIKQKLPAILSQDAARSKDILNAPNQWPRLFDKVKTTGHFSTPAQLLKRCFE